MAVLKSHDLGFDFRYVDYEEDWIIYHICFLWKDDPILREEVLKRYSDDDSNGLPEGYKLPQGTFLANDYPEDFFLPMLRYVLDTDESEYWEPMEPDIIVALYPESFFPFLKSHFVLLRESEQLKKKRAARKKLKEEKGKLPDDLYTFITFGNTKIFKKADSYSSSGFGLKMVIERQELEVFCNELEAEYTEFKRAFKIEA